MERRQSGGPVRAEDARLNRTREAATHLNASARAFTLYSGGDPVLNIWAVIGIGAVSAASPKKKVVLFGSGPPARQSCLASVNSITSPNFSADFRLMVPRPPVVTTNTSASWLFL
jgi:hypothetical protein